MLDLFVTAPPAGDPIPVNDPLDVLLKTLGLGDLAQSVLMLVAVAVGISLLILLTCYVGLWYDARRASSKAHSKASR